MVGYTVRQSGHLGSPHYADQIERRADLGLFPMPYDGELIKAGAETAQELGRG